MGKLVEGGAEWPRIIVWRYYKLDHPTGQKIRKFLKIWNGIIAILVSLRPCKKPSKKTKSRLLQRLLWTVLPVLRNWWLLKSIWFLTLFSLIKRLKCQMRVSFSFWRKFVLCQLIFQIKGSCSLPFQKRSFQGSTGIRCFLSRPRLTPILLAKWPTMVMKMSF